MASANRSAVVTSIATGAAIGVSDLKKQLTEYGEYVNRTLRPKWKEAIAMREAAEFEISEYVRLGEAVTRLLDVRDGAYTTCATAATPTNPEGGEKGDIGARDFRSHRRKCDDDAPLRGIVDVCHGHRNQLPFLSQGEERGLQDGLLPS